MKDFGGMNYNLDEAFYIGYDRDRMYTQVVGSGPKSSKPLMAPAPFISLLYTCFQLDCLSPQHRAQSAHLSYGDFLPTTEKPSSNQVTELQSQAYSGC